MHLAPSDGLPQNSPEPFMAILDLVAILENKDEPRSEDAERPEIVWKR